MKKNLSVIKTLALLLTAGAIVTACGNDELEEPSQTGKMTNAYLRCPDDHHPHAIDLGLPSGTKWCCCNVGASTPEGYGGYYAWGETKPKSTYNWSTYFDTDDGGSTFKKYYKNGGLTELLSEDDAATANWGSPWHMPTETQFRELFSNCTRQWTQQNGVDGILVKGPNGGQIFLPAAGRRRDDALHHAGFGDYWSSALSLGYDNRSYELRFNSGGWSWEDYPRDYGQSVRAVCQ